MSPDQLQAAIRKVRRGMKLGGFYDFDSGRQYGIFAHPTSTDKVLLVTKNNFGKQRLFLAERAKYESRIGIFER